MCRFRMEIKMILNVSRNEFPASNAKSEGMIEYKPKLDNYEIGYTEDIPYITRNGRTLYIQLVKPNCGEKLPLIVYIPGSAFHKQNVKREAAKMSYLAVRGFAVALLEYRESDIAPFPAQMLDAKAGVRFMKMHADQYGIDAEKVVVMGDSSGGHTAMMTGVTAGIDEFEKDMENAELSAVRCIIDLYGPTNFTTMNYEPSTQNHSEPDSPEGFEIGHLEVLDHPELAKAAAVATYVSAEREIPPILIFHGTNDELVPFAQACELNDALTHAGKTVKFYQVCGAHHGGREFWCTESLDIMEKFIREYTTYAKR